MREIFRLFFEQFTNQLTFLLDPVAQWIVIFVLHKIIFKLAFRVIGDFYRSRIISGRLVGSFLHWVFRSISFAIAWILVNFFVIAHNFVTKHWTMSIGTIGGILLFSVVVIGIRKILLQRRSKNSAMRLST